MGDFEKISDGKKRKKMADEKMDVREIIQDLQKELANYSRPSQTYRQMANDLDFDDELFDRIFDKHFQWSKNGFLKNSRLTDANRNRNKNWKINPQNQSPLVLPPNKKMETSLSSTKDENTSEEDLSSDSSYYSAPEEINEICSICFSASQDKIINSMGLCFLCLKTAFPSIQWD